jgi:hypothetical protein
MSFIVTKLENRREKQVLSGRLYQWEGEGVWKVYRRVNMV